MKKIYKILATTLIAGTIISCSTDYLETTPTGSVSDETIYSSLDNLYIALNGIHRKMVSADLGNQSLGGEPGFIIAREALADDMIWSNRSTWYRGYLTWQTYNTTGVHNAGVWTTYYQFILNANKILEGLEKLKSSSTFSTGEQAKYNQIRGEALCIRAWSYFYLIQYYAQRYDATTDNSHAGIPLRLSSAIINDIARSSVAEVYEQIHRDLAESIELLEGHKAAINHHTQKVALGLQARVFLTQQNYPQAAASAAKAIEVAESEGHRMMTYDQVNTGFASISTDTKDALYASTPQDDQSMNFYSFYAYMSWNFNSTAVRQGVKCISQSTYDLMSPTDARRAWWDPTGTASVPASSYTKNAYQNRKFTARSASNPVGDVAFMRLTELYLIAAEAYARAGDDTNAKGYLHAFIAERDKSYTDLGNTGDALAEEVMTHRRIELWGEGFRWFDLKRLKLPIDRTGSNFDVAFCGFLRKEPTDLGWYFYIPRTEVDNNKLIDSRE